MAVSGYDLGQGCHFAPEDRVTGEELLAKAEEANNAAKLGGKTRSAGQTAVTADPCRFQE